MTAVVRRRAYLMEDWASDLQRIRNLTYSSKNLSLFSGASKHMICCTTGIPAGKPEWPVSSNAAHMITASSSVGAYCFLITTVKCFATSGSRLAPSASLEQTALAISCSMVKMRESMASFGTTSLEKRGPKLAVKWEIVRRAEDTEMPTESFNAMLGISEKTTVL